MMFEEVGDIYPNVLADIIVAYLGSNIWSCSLDKSTVTIKYLDEGNWIKGRSYDCGGVTLPCQLSDGLVYPCHLIKDDGIVCFNVRLGRFIHVPEFHISCTITKMIAYKNEVLIVADWNVYRFTADHWKVYPASLNIQLVQDTLYWHDHAYLYELDLTSGRRKIAGPCVKSSTLFECAGQLMALSYQEKVYRIYSYCPETRWTLKTTLDLTSVSQPIGCHNRVIFEGRWYQCDLDTGVITKLKAPEPHTAFMVC